MVETNTFNYVFQFFGTGFSLYFVKPRLFLKAYAQMFFLSQTPFGEMSLVPYPEKKMFPIHFGPLPQSRTSFSGEKCVCVFPKKNKHITCCKAALVDRKLGWFKVGRRKERSCSLSTCQSLVLEPRFHTFSLNRRW